MRFPAELKYTKDHEWLKLDGKTATVGITDHAQSALGDIVYVDLPKVGKELKAGDTFGVVESIKAVSTSMPQPLEKSSRSTPPYLATHPRSTAIRTQAPG